MNNIPVLIFISKVMVIAAILTVVFAGDPDLQDAVIKWIMS